MITAVTIDSIEAAPSNRSALWARAFARAYDASLWTGERAGVHALRAELLGECRGRTVEIGAGTGLNLPHHVERGDDLILTEPDAEMRVRLERRVRRIGSRAPVVDAVAERLPFDDDTIDTVVSTFVLCTVPDADLALGEIVRVLRPGGQLLFLEHVRSESPRLARWQDRLAEPWDRFARGCRCNRPTVDAIASCGLTVDRVRPASWRLMPPIVRPLVVGRATLGDLDG
jgi:ubiquinone/menaquinone biosynthesis C-methylase UbiE